MTLKEQIKQELETKVPYSVIAEKLGCSKPYISLIKNNRDERRRKERLSNKDKIKVAFLWGADVGVDSIASQVNTTKLKVIRFLQDSGLIDAQP